MYNYFRHFGTQELGIILTILTFAIFLYILYKKYRYVIEYVKQEVKDYFIEEKELDIKDIIQLTNKYSVHLYNLKRNQDGTLDRGNLWYQKIILILNAKTLINLVEDGEELNLEVNLDEISLDRNKEEYLDIARYCSNFIFSSIVFNNDKTLLDDESNPRVKRILEHTDNVIQEVFADLCKQYEEKGIDDIIESCRI